VIAEGEVRQLAAVRNIDISRAEYMSIIDAKTAALFCGRRPGQPRS
jgi:octaprenyl-diphosphate synthase